MDILKYTLFTAVILFLNPAQATVLQGNMQERIYYDHKDNIGIFQMQLKPDTYIRLASKQKNKTKIKTKKDGTVVIKTSSSSNDGRGNKEKHKTTTTVPPSSDSESGSGMPTGTGGGPYDGD